MTRRVFQGADVNAKDKESRSPLLLAASRGGWRTVNTLIRLGANIRVKDSNSRNVLHLVVMNGGRLDELAATVINVSRVERKTKTQNLVERNLETRGKKILLEVILTPISK